MAILTLISSYDRLLHRRAEEATFPLSKEMRRLIVDLFETLATTPSGIGLAAPQVGVAKAIAIVALGEERFAMVNPKITHSSKKRMIKEEGCLSYPNTWGEVRRAFRITAEYTNEKGEKVRKRATDLLARVIQHEIDHLEGKVFLDRMEGKPHYIPQEK
ncbi:MAG: peptide deformylase [Parcubacteria group bacterium]|nr:peptide deformylase [Parcubacteria group bacterium]